MPLWTASLENVIAKPDDVAKSRTSVDVQQRFVCNLPARVGTIGPSKPGATPEPIVTPLPPIYRQWAPPLGPLLMRPRKVLDAKRDMTPDEMAEAKKADAEAIRKWEAEGKPKATKPSTEGVNTWIASGCHPSCVSMQVIWLLMHPRSSQGLVVPNRGDKPSLAESNPLWVTKWLWDPEGDPKRTRYESQKAGDHPPWVPRSAGAKEWNVNHSVVLKSVAEIKNAKGALRVENIDLSKAAPRDAKAKEVFREEKKRKLKEALLTCGPMTILMTHPGHYVLLYGYRGRHMYIIDPGNMLLKFWAPPAVKDKPYPHHIFSILPPTKEGFRGSHVVLDAEHKLDVNCEGKYNGTFLDCLLAAQGYHCPGIDQYTEFLTQPAPDGRLLDGTVPGQVAT